MTIDLLTQLVDYGAYHDDEQGSVEAADILAAVGSHPATVEATRSRATDRLDRTRGLGDDYLPQSRVESEADPGWGRWPGALIALVATILVVVGVVVVADGTSGEVSIDSVASPEVDQVVRYRWSRVPHDEAVFGGARGQMMQSVAVGGPGLVAVGSVGNDGDAAAAVWTSFDGVTWSRVPHDEAVFGGPGGQWMSSVTAGGPGLVAVGSDGRFGEGNEARTADGWYQWGEQDGAAAVWTSVDGIRWSRVPHDEAVFGGEADQEMTSVTVGGPGLVAVGSVGNDGDAAAAVWTSVDGIRWSRVPHDEAVFGGPGGQWMSSVTAGGPGLVAVGAGAGRMTADEGHVDWQVVPAVWVSADGISWSRVPHDEAVFGGEGGRWMSSVTAGGPGLVAVGAEQLGDDVPSGRALDAAVWTSVDGITWSRVRHDLTLFGGTGNQRIHGVSVSESGLVAVGADGGFYDTRPDAVVWTSVDGLAWSRLAHDEAVFAGAEMHDVVVAGAGLVAVGDGSLESMDSLSREQVIESGDSVFVWIAEPEGD